MSDPTRCDVCGTVGKRRRGQVAPEDWLWGEVFPLDDNNRFVLTGDTHLIRVCGVECAKAFWKKGPGRLVNQNPCEGERAMVDMLEPKSRYEVLLETTRVEGGDGI